MNSQHPKLIVRGLIMATSSLLLVGCPQQGMITPQSDSPQPPQASQRAPGAGPTTTSPTPETAGVSTASPSPYPTAKRDFRYGPAQPWPKLALGPDTPPGPLARIEPEAPAPAGPCATTLAGASLDVGPQDAWLAQAAKKTATGLLGNLLRSSGFGFGGGDSASDTPPTVKDPISEKARQQFHDELSDIEMSLAGRLDDQQLLLSSYIDDAPDKSTFHTVFLENKDCRRTWPDRYLAYKLWLEWSLSVSWTKTRRSYRDGEMVSETSKSGGFQKSGEITLAEGRLKFGDAEALSAYQRELFEQLPPPAWQQMGFSSPLSGVRGMGSQFNQVNPTELLSGDTIAVVHVTRVQDGRYITRGMPFKMEAGENGLLRFTRL